MKISIKVHTQYGEFESVDFDVSRQQYDNLKEEMKTISGKSYYLNTEKGCVFIPENIMNQSIIEIKIKKRHVAE